MRSVSQILLRRNVNNSLLRNRLSTEITNSGSILPPNLILADISILTPPKPSIAAPMDYMFPRNDIPSQIEVRCFSKPSEPSTTTAILHKKVFGVAIRTDIVAQVVRYQRAKIRQPHKTKTVDEIRGSTRKLWQQKGTGRARVSLNRASGRKGGAKAHGPVLRDFSFSLNRKFRALAMMIAIAAKQREGNLIIFDKIACDVSVNNIIYMLVRTSYLSPSSV
jgi:large subunit ribosomal protein L4